MAWCFLSILPLSLSADQDPPRLQQEHPRESTEWIVSHNYNANDDKLPRVLLVGDSICEGYQRLVRNELAASASVSFYATSKCVTDKTYLRALSFILDEYKYSVIHFNNGLHSLSSNRQDWEACLRASIRLIKEKGNGSKLIWASSTPLKDPEATAKAQELNAIAAKVMREEGIPTNDLFAQMEPLDRNAYWVDKYHFTDEAKKLQAKTIATCIRETLGVPKASSADAQSALKAAATATGPSGKLD